MSLEKEKLALKLCCRNVTKFAQLDIICKVATTWFLIDINDKERVIEKFKKMKNKGESERRNCQ
jgi:hypothetical protein